MATPTPPSVPTPGPQTPSIQTPMVHVPRAAPIYTPYATPGGLRMNPGAVPRGPNVSLPVPGKPVEFRQTAAPRGGCNCNKGR